MNALILSAGLGTRLRPIMPELPKVMAPLKGKPLLEHHIEQFKKYGVRELLINLHYLPDKITGYFGNGSKWGVKIIYRYESEILGTAGAIKNFEKELTDPFFLIYGDILAQVDYAKFYRAFREKPDAIGMGIIGTTDHPWDSDLAEVDCGLRFLKIYPKPHRELPGQYHAMRGVYVFKKKAAEYIPPGAYFEIDHNLLPILLKSGLPFYGYLTSEYIKDIGTPERYEQVKKYLQERKEKSIEYE